VVAVFATNREVAIETLMTTTTESRIVARPITDVFALVSDFTTTAQWDPGVRSAVQTTRGRPAAGTCYEVVAVFLGAAVPMRYRIESMVVNERLVLQGTSVSSTAYDDIRFSTVPEGTRIEWTLKLQLRGASRLASPLMGPVVRRIGKNALDGLAAWLGGGSK
jgi:dehydrogenase/reductase SDR family member 12